MSIKRGANDIFRNNSTSGTRSKLFKYVGLLSLLGVTLGALMITPGLRAGAANSTKSAGGEVDENRRIVKDFDVNYLRSAGRLPSASQLRSLDQFKTNVGDQKITSRWDKATGSLDVVYDFASAPSSLDPESTARAFIAANAGLFGTADISSLKLTSNVQALGGNLLYFQQVYQGLSVSGRGIGVVMDGQRRVKAISGPYAAGLSLSTTPAISGAMAISAAQNNLAPYKKQWSAAVAAILNPAYDVVESEIGPFATPQPELNLFPTPDGVRLAYNLFLFSRNPFGVYEYQIDAGTGQVLKRTNRVLYQEPLPYTADIYPSSPKLKNPDTGELALNDMGEPDGLLRVHLRKFNTGTNVTAVDGLMTGQHAIIRNLLVTKQPFAQAALGTFHFRQNNPPLEAQPNETDDLAEPSEHLDMANNFFFITYLLEYIDHLHRAGDSVHSGIGQGSFPDAYPNSDRPLVGMVHLPSDQGALGLSGPLDTTDQDTIIHSILGMDNAVSFNLTRSVTLPDGSTQQVVINPTAYGHGYLFNDLAKDGPAVYHEGMHSISTPIAGFDGGTVEGGALNEGQADLWAYTITEDPVLGHYIANGWRRRARIRAAGGDPDLRQWIRNADSGLSYSQLGTSGGSSFEVHRDGEIYASTVWDLRQLMQMVYPQTTGIYKRPAMLSGNPEVAISLGKETWERLQLGSTYVMGTFAPDTIVRFRDSLIIADAALYSSDPLDPDAPGIHRALIEQVFAARELGINAAPPADGKQTISTQVSAFAASQGKPAAPVGVSATPTSGTSTRISWQPVSGAFGYQILRRQIGKENKRQNSPVPGREYIDGDGSTDGYLGIDYVSGGETAYVDNGNIESGLVRRGNGNAIAYEYVVRALGVNANKQVGISDNSAQPVFLQLCSMSPIAFKPRSAT
jgi:fungalysin metallopeptidase (M36)